MDPFAAVVAIANTVTELTKAANAAVAGMTPEQRKIHWDQYQQGMAVWLALLKPLQELILRAAATPPRPTT